MANEKEHIRIAMDLEFYAEESFCDTTRVIQLGYSIFNVHTKQILYTGGDYIKINTPLSNFIIGLTGIHQQDIDNKGVTVVEAVLNMNQKCEEYGVTFSQFATWGNGDPEALLAAYLKQLNKTDQPRDKLQDIDWKFGTSYLNLKSVYQAQRMQEHKGRRGGLKKSCSSLGLIWEVFSEVVSVDELGRKKIKQRTAHDARCDSLNTAKIYMELFK